MDLLYCVPRSKSKEVQLELGKFARLSWEIFFHRVDCRMCLHGNWRQYTFWEGKVSITSSLEWQSNGVVS